MKQHILSIALCALALAGAAQAADQVGIVSSVAGEATAQQPGAEPRALACGDPVYVGDTLRTGAGSRVGVQLDDVAAHLDANSRVVLGRTPESMPAARLEAGRVRMIDPRDAGAPAELAALDAHAAVMSNDAEAYLFSEKVGPYAMLCEWDAPLPVNRGSEQKTAAPGECVIAKPKEPLYVANGHDVRIPAVADACEPGPELASLNSPLYHLTPEDVAAPGPFPGAGHAGFGPVNPAAAQFPGYAPCDVGDACPQPLPTETFEPDPGFPPCDGVPGCQ
jgi:hypothetical protein